MLPNSSHFQLTTKAESDVAIPKERNNENEPSVLVLRRRAQQSIPVQCKRFINRKERKIGKELLDEKISAMKPTAEISSETNMESDTEHDNQETDSTGCTVLPCCKIFKRPADRFSHIKENHSKDATTCGLCDKKLSSKSSLDRHLLTHAQYQPYKCDQCDKHFSTNGNMHRHKKTHESVSKSTSPKASVKKETMIHNEKIESIKKTRKSIKSGAVKTEKVDLDKKIKRKSNSDEASSIQIIKKTKVEDLNLSSDELKLNITENNDNSKLIKDSINSESPELESDLIYQKCTQEDTKMDLGSSSAIVEDLLINEIKQKECLEAVHNLTSESTENSSSISVKNEDITSEENSADKIGEKEINNDVNSESQNGFGQVQDDFADISSIISNVRTQSKIEIPNQSFQTLKEVCNKIFDRQYGQWLPESPETSIENFEPLANKYPEKDETREVVQFVCEYCNKKLKNAYILKKHKLKHNKPKSFKCIKCESLFPNKPNALRHVTNVHKISPAEARPFVKYNLMQCSSPSVESNSVCEWCGQDFTSSLILGHHKRSSTGCTKKPYVCNICFKRFSTKNNGKRHQTKHHQEMKNCIIPNDESSSNLFNTVAEQSTDSNTGEESYDSDDNNHNDESSDKCSATSDIISNCSESEIKPESEVSSQKKIEELEVAHSLLDMSTGTPSQFDACRIYNHEQLNNSAIECITANIAVPKSLSPQNQPLDLSIRPIDLTAKAENNSYLYDGHNFHKKSLFSSLLEATSTHRKEFMNNEDIKSHSEAPLNLVKKRLTYIDHNESSNHLCRTSSTMNEYSDNDVIFAAHETWTKNAESNSLSEENKHQCNICLNSFSSVSNKKRHEKKIHQLHTVEGQKPCRSPLNLKLIDSPISIPLKSLISKKTKEALLTKVASKPIAENFMQESSQQTQSFPLVNEVETGDLASVSSLISTANSPQLKNFLISDGVNSELASAAEIERHNNSTKPKPDGKKNDKNIHCPSCKRSFNCPSSFARHAVTHTKEKPYNCPFCPKTFFTVKSNKDRHIKKFHSQAPTDNVIQRKKLKINPTPDMPSPPEVSDAEMKDMSSPLQEEKTDNKENQIIHA